MDDITILTNLTNLTYQHHIEVLARFLDKVIYHGFTLNLEKCQFLRTSVRTSPCAATWRSVK